MYWGEDRCVQGVLGRGWACTGFCLGNLRERDHLGDPGIDGMIILKMDLQEVGCGVVDWFELAQDRTGGGHL